MVSEGSEKSWGSIDFWKFDGGFLGSPLPFLILHVHKVILDESKWWRRVYLISVCASLSSLEVTGIFLCRYVILL